MKKVFIAALAGAAFVMAGCHHTPQPEAEGKVEISDSLAKFIAVDTAKNTNVQNELQLVGEVSFDEDKVMKIYPNAGGVVQGITVSLGDYVQKGQTLCILRSPDIAGQQGDLAAAISDSISAKKNLDAVQDLFSNGLTAETDVVNARSGYQKAVAQLKKLRLTLSINNGDGGDAVAVIRAPQAGFILEKKLNNGMIVRPDNSDYLFSIGDLNEVWVLANVYETDLDKVKIGMEADVKTITYPDKVFKGKVEKEASMLDPVSKVMKIRIRLNNSEHLLKPEMFTSVTLHWEENQKKIMIPGSALIMENSRNYVVLYHNRKDLETREVQVDREVGDKAFIESGLAEGDRVVSRSQLIIYEALKD